MATNQKVVHILKFRFIFTLPGCVLLNVEQRYNNYEVTSCSCFYCVFSKNVV